MQSFLGLIILVAIILMILANWPTESMYYCSVPFRAREPRSTVDALPSAIQQTMRRCIKPYFRHKCLWAFVETITQTLVPLSVCDSTLRSPNYVSVVNFFNHAWSARSWQVATHWSTLFQRNPDKNQAVLANLNHSQQTQTFGNQCLFS
jgi:hypothetical protein